MAFALGATCWLPLEQLMHRWIFHHGRHRLARQHRRHHLHPTWHPPFFEALIGAVVIGVIASLVGPAFGLGLVTGYLAYEGLHRAVHSTIPLGPFEPLRTHHLAHHARPARHFGITLPW